jgi:DNA-binding transcriptional MocR family regulator
VLRQTGRERRDALRASCARHLPEWARLGPAEGGGFACIHLPARISDREVVRRMRAAGVIAVALSSGCIDPRNGHGLVIGFGAFDAFTIDRSVAVIGQSIKEVAAAGDGSAAHQRAGENR